MPPYDHLFETNFVANRDCVTHFGSGLAIGQPLQTNKTRCDKKCLWHLIVWCSYAIIMNCLMFKWKIQSTNPCAKRKCWLDSGADWSFFPGSYERAKPKSGQTKSITFKHFPQIISYHIMIVLNVWNFQKKKPIKYTRTSLYQLGH